MGLPTIDTPAPIHSRPPSNPRCRSLHRPFSTKRFRIGTVSPPCINAHRTIHSIRFQLEAITLEKIVSRVNYQLFV